MRRWPAVLFNSMMNIPPAEQSVGIHFHVIVASDIQPIPVGPMDMDGLAILPQIDPPLFIKHYRYTEYWTALKYLLSMAKRSSCPGWLV